MSASTELAPRVEMPEAPLAPIAGGPLPLVFTPADIEVINNTIAKDLSDGERAFFLRACQATGLNPLLKEIHVWRDGGKLQIHTGIDGLAKIAAEYHPDYCGMEGPYWCGDDGHWRDFWPKKFGNPVAAKARVLLRGAKTGFITVMWDDFAKPPPARGPGMWQKMPAHMLGVAARRHALRMTCPRARKAIDMLALSEELDMAPADSLGARIQEDVAGAPALSAPRTEVTPTSSGADPHAAAARALRDLRAEWANQQFDPNDTAGLQDYIKRVLGRPLSPRSDLGARTADMIAACEDLKRRPGALKAAMAAYCEAGGDTSDGDAMRSDLGRVLKREVATRRTCTTGELRRFIEACKNPPSGAAADDLPDDAVPYDDPFQDE